MSEQRPQDPASKEEMIEQWPTMPVPVIQALNQDDGLQGLPEGRRQEAREAYVHPDAVTQPDLVAIQQNAPTLPHPAVRPDGTR